MQATKRRRASALCLTLCCSCVSKVYIEADRATYQAIEPEYRAYVMKDVDLTQEQKERRFLTLQTWLQRIETAEGGK